MAKYSIEDTSLSAIVDIPREKLGMGEQKVPFSEIPSLITQSLSKASQEGYDGGYSAGEEAGQKSEYDAFWDEYQGARAGQSYAYYHHAFAGRNWTDKIFKPKYDIIVRGYAEHMLSGTYIQDLKGCLEECGVTLDTSKATNVQSFGYDSQLTRVPTLDFSSATNLNYTLFSCDSLVSVDKIILKSDGSQTSLTNLLSACPKLVEVRFEGAIGANVNVSKSTILSHDSIVSIVNALSSTATGKTLVLSKAAVDIAFEELELAEDGKIEWYVPGSSSTEWLALADTKTNWTISLA